jgi:phage anti-repressor protein
MGITEKMWDGISRVIRMDAKVEGLAETIKVQQRKIEDLTARIIRLETALEIAMATRHESTHQKLAHDDDH